MATNSNEGKLFILDRTCQKTFFAGSGVAGVQDGPVSTCKLNQPVSIAVENGGVIYVCDSQTSSIKIITKLEQTALFLQSIGRIFEAFSIHTKGENYK